MDGQPRDHIVQVPNWFGVVRYVQIGLAFLVIVLSGYGLSAIIALGGAGYAIFVAIATIVVCVWYTVAVLKSPSLYNGIAVLVLECFMVIWWLASWTNLAAWASAYGFVDAVNSSASLESYRAAMAAAAAIGAVNFVLFKVTLIVFAIRFHRHRIAGRPWSYRGKWANGAVNGSGAQNNNEPIKIVPAQNIHMQPQQTYQQPARVPMYQGA